MKAAIVARARELGAGSVRIADAAPDPAARERMRRSFARGDHATWGYDDRYAAAASDPSHVLAGARSVVCVAIPYTVEPSADRSRGTGRVSNYAWSSDYHRRVREILEQLAATIDALAGGASTRVVCDTAPLAERAFAERAGLGWQGKHTNLISPELGSFIFLGEIVTTLALEPDPPLRKTCGSCTRCVTVCPTGALRGDYTIDATRCISDLTQRTDAIPRALRAFIGTWVWGCDLCQDVCPPTRRAGYRGDAFFAPFDESAAAPSLQALLALRSGEYRRRYRRTAMGWRGAAVLRRNAAVAMGNLLDRADVPSLTTALRTDPHPQVRGHAAWALGRIGSPAARRALAQAERSELETTVREEIRYARIELKENER